MVAKKSLLLRFTAAMLLIAAPHFAYAQATRTWVSGVGDDVNPCSRTAPCKTFAGAISKTAVGGEINVLDPGGYGTVSITKSITIDGGQGGGWASILNSGGINGIIVNGAGLEVTLRNLSINGAGTTPGLNGIRIIAASKVWIENVLISGNSNRGISEERTLPGQLNVISTIVRNNDQTGITVIPASGSTGVDAYLTDVHMVNNGNSGLAVSNGGRVTMSRSHAHGNAAHGVYVDSSSFLFLSDSVLSGNTTGITLGAGNPTVSLSNNVITNNDNGVALSGNSFYSFGNNRIGGNMAANSGFPIGSVGSQ